MIIHFLQSHDTKHYHSLKLGKVIIKLTSKFQDWATQQKLIYPIIDGHIEFLAFVNLAHPTIAIISISTSMTALITTISPTIPAATLFFLVIIIIDKINVNRFK